MIDRLEVRNWKRYRHQVVEFSPGLNFVLGANGSGKSSLLQAIAFALSGVGPGSLPPKDAIHMGSTGGASVSLRLGRPESVATITRTIDPRGKMTEALRSDASDITSISVFVARLLGAEPSDVERLLFLNEGDIYSNGAGDMDLDRHLEKLLAIGPLRQLKGVARDHRRSMARLLKTQRGQLRLSKDEVAQLSDRRAVLEAELQTIEESEPALLAKNQEASALVRSIEDQHAADAELARWRADVMEMLRGSLANVEAHAALDSLQGEVEEAERAVRELIARRGWLEGEIAAIKSVLEQLEGGAGDQPCPLCEQPLASGHSRRLVDSQRARLAQVSAELEELGEVTTREEMTLTGLQSTVAALHSLMARRPSETIPRIVVPENLASLVELSRGAIEAVRDRRHRVFDELASVRERVASAETDRRIEEEVVDAFRKDALLEIVENSITSFTAGVRSGLVSPLSQELSVQWKRFRPRSPWNLLVGDDGLLAIEMHGERRSFGALSAGEKTVAVILLHIALSVAFTSADFIILDEPLEHLDPRTRRVLVSSLQHAVAQGLVEQIIVTTYEEVLVRRLQQEGLASAIYLD